MVVQFTKVIPASCLRGSGLVLPPEFRDAVVKESGHFILENGQGKQWACSITRKTQGAHERCDITGGWRVFAADNGLQVGDEILVKHKGGRVIQITTTGKTGVPRTPKTPAARKTPGKTPAKKAPAAAATKKTPAANTPASRGKPAAAAAAARGGSKTPGSAAGGVSKRRRSSSGAAATPASAGRRNSRGGAAAAAAAVAEREEQGSGWCAIM